MWKLGKSVIQYGDRSFHSPIDVFTAQLSELTIHFTHWSPLQQRALYNQDTLHHLRTISAYQNTVISTGLIGSCLCEKNYVTIPFAGGFFQPSSEIHRQAGSLGDLLKESQRQRPLGASWTDDLGVCCWWELVMFHTFQSGDRWPWNPTGPGWTGCHVYYRSHSCDNLHYYIQILLDCVPSICVGLGFAYIVYNHVSHTFIAYILQKSTCFVQPKNLHIWFSTISGNITCLLSTQARHSEQWDPRWQRWWNLINHGFMALWRVEVMFGRCRDDE